RSFDVGDVIESGGLRGVVKAIDLKDTHIRTADGCDIFIPSAQIFRNPLLNFTRDGLRRVTFTVGIDYGDDPAEALGLLRDALPRVPGVLARPPMVVEVADLSASWVEVRAHLWVDTLQGSTPAAVRSEAVIAARHVLRAGGFTFSADVTTALAVPPLDVRLGGGAHGAGGEAPPPGA
ncbi:MAG: mechanosensitive ion channel, partial [Longimicrobiales bacterium]|nr:mechanosensitive ion channel [Longimicrobiales bacterium]